MIIETVVSTIDRNNQVNFAPMGVVFVENSVLMRPFCSSRTFQNLRATRQAVVNITDNVLILTWTALGKKDVPHFPTKYVKGYILADVCRYYEIEVEHLWAATPRAEVSCRILAEGRLRDFIGFNRAKHAVIEAAIMASRLHLLSRDQVREKLLEYRLIVEKTGSRQEKAAMEFIEKHMERGGRP